VPDHPGGVSTACPVIVEGEEEVPRGHPPVRAFREAQRLTLKDISERCDLDLTTLSQLETGKQANPKLLTILLCVGAVGRRLHFSVHSSAEAALPPRRGRAALPDQQDR
jgi:transcriptional regulator with XRE-family HTH domain